MVVGHSGGVSIACCLVVRHPAVVRHAVIYEAPLFAVAPKGKEIFAGMRAAAEQAMTEGGPRRAMELFMRGNAGDEVVEAFKSIDPAGYDRGLENGADRRAG